MGSGESSPPPSAKRAAIDAPTEPIGAHRPDHVATGFLSVDNLLGGGPRRGDLVVLCGDVGVGKSALALAIALRSGAAGHTVALLSGEMTPPRLTERAVALQTRARVDDVRRGAVTPMPGHTPGESAAPAPVLVPLPESGVDGIARFLAAQLGLELLIVDPLQSLATGARALDEDLAAAARRLKELALQHSACVLVVSHLARPVRERPDRRPVLEDLGGLATVRQHADIVLGLYREELYDASPQVEGATELHVLKNRNGALGFVDLYFYKQWLRFEDVVE